MNTLKVTRVKFAKVCVEKSLKELDVGKVLIKDSLAQLNIRAAYSLLMVWIFWSSGDKV